MNRVARFKMAIFLIWYGKLLFQPPRKKPWKWDSPVVRACVIMMPHRTLVDQVFRLYEEREQLREELYRLKNHHISRE